MKHLIFGILVFVCIGVSAQSNKFTIVYDGISPSKNSPHEKDKSGNIGIHNPERGYSVRAGLMDIYAENFPWDAAEPGFYEDVNGDVDKGSGILSVEDYLSNFANDGISLVELEHYVHFSEDNLDDQDPLDNDHLNLAKSVVFNLRDQGVKTHLIMNSSFKFYSNGNQYQQVAQNSDRNKGLQHYMEEMSDFYNEISPMVAVAHLGWMYSPWDYNSYRLSSKWKNQNYSIWDVYPVGDIPAEPYEGYEDIANYHDEYRESVQRTDWGPYHGSGGGPWNLKSDINKVRKQIIDNVLDYFPYQKVITNSTFPWTNYIGTSLGSSQVNGPAVERTFMSRYAPGNHSYSLSNLKDGTGYSRIGYYDAAFAGDSYSSGWSIPDGEVYPIHWNKGYKSSEVTLGTDWRDNKYNTDAFLLRKFRHNIWMHGELPVYETEDTLVNDATNPWAWNASSFNKHHSYFQSWYPNVNTGERNTTFDFEIAEGISSGRLQDGLMSALKMRYFNFSSFSIAHNNLLDGRSPYEMPDGYTASGLTGDGVPLMENTAVSKWKNTTISLADAEKWHFPISDHYFIDEDNNEVDRTIYEFIRDHLGYRLELQASDFEQNESSLSVQTKLINRGFAAPQNPRRAYFVLLNEDNEVIDQKVINTDWRAWQPDDFAVAHDNETNLNYNNNASLDDVKIGGLPLGEFNSKWHHTPLDITYTPNVHSFGAQFSLEGLMEGEYKVGLCMPDINEELFNQPEDYAVKFANAAPYLDCSGITLLGAIQIGTGQSDSDADGIADILDEHPFNPTEYLNANSGPMENCTAWLNIPVVEFFEVLPEVVGISNIKLYPNPSNGIYYLDFDGMVENVEIEIFNILGQLVFSNSYAGVEDVNLDLQFLETGTYMLNVSGGEYSEVIKMIKR